MAVMIDGLEYVSVRIGSGDTWMFPPATTQSVHGMSVEHSCSLRTSAKRFAPLPRRHRELRAQAPSMQGASSAKPQSTSSKRDASCAREAPSAIQKRLPKEWKPKAPSAKKRAKNSAPNASSAAEPVVPPASSAAVDVMPPEYADYVARGLVVIEQEYVTHLNELNMSYMLRTTCIAEAVRAGNPRAMLRARVEHNVLQEAVRRLDEWRDGMQQGLEQHRRAIEVVHKSRAGQEPLD